MTTAESEPDDLAMIVDWIAGSGWVVALTGAGISTESGIPDFRGPQGVWTRDPAAQRMFTLDAYVSDPELRRRAWRHRRDHPAWNAAPNAGHRALVDLERAGRLHAIITQNIDGLHQRAGSDPDRVIEVHGTLRETECVSCGDRRPMAETLRRCDAGDEDPRCLACGGIVKSATISFGQPLVRDVFERAVEVVRQADLLLALGSSLSVQPVAGLVGFAAKRGARVVIVNAEPTPYDDRANAVIAAPIGEVLPRLAAAIA